MELFRAEKFGDFESKDDSLRGCRFCENKLRLVRLSSTRRRKQPSACLSATAASALGTSKVTGLRAPSHP
jgi:hypothetical protein